MLPRSWDSARAWGRGRGWGRGDEREEEGEGGGEGGGAETGRRNQRGWEGVRGLLGGGGELGGVPWAQLRAGAPGGGTNPFPPDGAPASGSTLKTSRRPGPALPACCSALTAGQAASPSAWGAAQGPGAESAFAGLAPACLCPAPSLLHPSARPPHAARCHLCPGVWRQVVWMLGPAPPSRPRRLPPQPTCLLTATADAGDLRFKEPGLHVCEGRLPS